APVATRDRLASAKAEALAFNNFFDFMGNPLMRARPPIGRALARSGRVLGTTLRPRSRAGNADCPLWGTARTSARKKRSGAARGLAKPPSVSGQAKARPRRHRSRQLETQKRMHGNARP